MVDLILNNEEPKSCFKCGETFPNCQCHFEELIKSNCDCKGTKKQLAEARKLIPYLQEILDGHSDKNSAEYNECENGKECAWCEEVKKIIDNIK